MHARWREHPPPVRASSRQRGTSTAAEQGARMRGHAAALERVGPPLCVTIIVRDEVFDSVVREERDQFRPELHGEHFVGSEE